MALPHNVRYLLLQRGFMVAAEVPASAPDRRAWVSVFYNEGSERPFIVRYVVIEERWLDGSDITEDDAEVYEQFHAKDEAELVSLLRRWLDDLDRLVVDEIAGYPY